MTNKTGERGPVYDVELIDTLPVGGMHQAMPGRKELERVRQVSERTAAAYEVLLHHYHEAVKRVGVLENGMKELKELLLEDYNRE